MESKSVMIYNFLEQKIAQGEYLPGDRLPSESELCTEFKVSRGPVRAALDKLTALGLVFKKKGGGSYVNVQGSTDILNVVLPTLRFSTNDYKEILQMRFALDKLGVELYLQNNSGKSHPELEAVMEAMEQDHTIDEFFKLDRLFHTTISNLSGNQLLHSFNLLLWDLLQHCPKEEYYACTRDEWLDDHRRICRSIEEEDTELAVVFSVRHLQRMINQDKKNQTAVKGKHRWNPWLYDTL